MTLIIGCITKEFGIIAGDTQLSSGDLARGEFDRIIQHKVHQYGPDFMMGILGKWSFIHPMKDGTGILIDYNRVLHRSLNDSKNGDKLDLLKKFLSGKPNIEATAIYVVKDKEYVLDCVTSDGNTKTIKRIDIDGKSLMFNEPFHTINPDFIESIILAFCAKHKLDDSLQDCIFLINNVILEIIAKGKTIDLSANGVTNLGIPNSIGGYITMQILTGDIHHRNCMYRVYNDLAVLLDGTTYPFARSVDRTKKINYVDNLAMLTKTSNDSRNEIIAELKEVLVKQLNFVHSEGILNKNLLNYLIEIINVKFKMKLEKFKEDPPIPSLAEFMDDDQIEENHEYFRRFF